MEKYLYLTQHSWVTSWVEGGEVPLVVSSTYLSQERSGTLTPDENLIESSTHPQSIFGSSASVTGRDNFIGTFVRNGEVVANNIMINHYVEDGLVLCLANSCRDDIARGLGKLACVKIHDVNELKATLDEQVGSASIMGPCKYTTSYHRNHFLKSVEDEWQDEFRLFWKGIGSRTVIIPKGIGVQVPILGA